MRTSMLMALMLAGGCANADGGGEDEDATVAQLLTTALHDEASAVATSAQLVRGALPDGFHTESGFAVGGDNAVYLATCYSTQGTAMPCDHAARAVVLGSWGTAKLRREVTWTFDGLETGAAHLGGSSSLIVAATGYELSGDATHDAVVDLATGQIPRGTESLTLTVTRDGHPQSTSAQVTFDGAAAHIDLNGNSYDVPGGIP